MLHRSVVGTSHKEVKCHGTKTLGSKGNPSQRKLSVAWPPFEKALASALAKLEEDQFLVISAKRGDRFVQFAGQGSFGMRAETASNGFLPKSEQLDDEQIKALGALGWSSPTGTPETSTPETEPDGSPNFFRDFAQPVRHEAIAELAVRTLRRSCGCRIPGSWNTKRSAMTAH